MVKSESKISQQVNDEVDLSIVYLSELSDIFLNLAIGPGYPGFILELEAICAMEIQLGLFVSGLIGQDKILRSQTLSNFSFYIGVHIYYVNDIQSSMFTTVWWKAYPFVDGSFHHMLW